MSGMEMFSCYTALVLLLYVSEANSYSEGAASSACNDMEMKPNHGGGVSTLNEGQFEITLQSLEYDPLNPRTVSVKISSSIGSMFKGFLIQARKVNSFDRIAKGAMNGPPSLSGPVCGTTGNGMTHTSQFSNNWSLEISLSWTPVGHVCDRMKMGDLHFQATVVRSYSEPAQVLIYSPIMKMKNVTDAKLIEECKDRIQNGTSGITLSLTLTAITLLLLLF